MKRHNVHCFTRRSSPLPRRRGGSVYLAVLGTSLIVSVMALSALTVQRTQRRAYSGTFDVVEARLYAQAAVRMGLLRIEQDPDWRYNRPNGDWAVDAPVGSGTYTLRVTDPSDNDFRDAIHEPVLVTGTGRKGAAVQTLSVKLSPTNRALNCLDTALHAGGNLTFASARVQSNRILSSNQTISATASSVNGDVQAVGSINGSSYNGARSALDEALETPDPARVFDYYKANGTWISISAIPPASPAPNLILNPGAEAGTSPWYGYNNTSTLMATTTTPHSGSAALGVTQVKNNNGGPAQDLTGRLVNGMNYETQVWVRSADARSRRIRLRLETTTGTNDTSLTPFLNTTRNTWSRISASSSISWTGSLIKAEWWVETQQGTADYALDDARLSETSLPGRIIRGQALSPANNPFGPATNPQGVYVIDCQGQDLLIERSRIVGTLVLLNPGPGSAVRAASIHWQPAVANFPALLVDGNMTVRPVDQGLSEFQNATNFNPPGTPYGVAGEDADQNDTYPSQIDGLVYTSGNLSLEQQPVIRGVVVAGGGITVTGNLNLTFQPAFAQNPPPGFSGPEQIGIVLNSVTKVAD